MTPADWKATEDDLRQIATAFDRAWVTPEPIDVNPCRPDDADLPLLLLERLHDRATIEDLTAFVNGYRQLTDILLNQIQVQQTYMAIQAKTIEGYRDEARARLVTP